MLAKFEWRSSKIYSQFMPVGGNWVVGLGTLTMDELRKEIIFDEMAKRDRFGRNGQKWSIWMVLPKAIDLAKYTYERALQIHFAPNSNVTVCVCVHKKGISITIKCLFDQFERWLSLQMIRYRI